MSYIETTYCGVKSIKVEPADTRTNPSTGKLFTTQHIKLVMSNGESTWFTLHLDNECNALALGEIVHNDSKE